MSRLRIFSDARPDVVAAEHTDGADIAAALAPIGVRFERWATREDVIAGADPDSVLEAYRGEIDALMAEEGYQSCDVVSMAPDNPQKAIMRAKFLDEHTHGEDEVRFFVDGQGLFSLHADDEVYEILCERGDLIKVPAGTRHWFDMGPNPHFLAIRLFINPDGWVANFTGADIAARFPRLAN